MKTSRIIQLTGAGLLVGVGSIALLIHAPDFVAVICLYLPAIVVLRRPGSTGRLSLRELWIIIVTTVVVSALLAFANLLLPKPLEQHFIHRPIFVVLLWVCMMSGLVWRWRRQRRLSDA
jgi:hypothetical protein